MQDRNLIPIISQKELEGKVKYLGKKISSDYKDKNPILVGILKGSFIFLADLVRQLTIPHEVDFISVGSYGSSTQASGVVRLIKDLSVNIEGRNVVIIEDIVDTGLTLNYIRDNLLSRKPKSVSILTLLEKKQRRPQRIPIKYVGFKIPSDFVVGYGLDYDEKYRNLPYIAKLKF
ncbi:MAG TPA: hypoxanthine phosphoribosyltransferase [candidate division Zixibacteria bacterium]|nr:hypoxanthine phosphoribosyltransferase [candidate division Zixibacteria bacterium]